MPFVSGSQRRKFYAMANRGEISHATLKEWEDATPKGKKLPEHVKKSHVMGMVDALSHFGLKQAAEELRLKLPSRTFHGLDAAHKNTKKAEGATSEVLSQIFDQLETPKGPADQAPAKDRLDRQTAWGAPSNLSAGDVAGRLSDMGQNTSFGGI